MSSLQAPGDARKRRRGGKAGWSVRETNTQPEKNAEKQREATKFHRTNRCQQQKALPVMNRTLRIFSPGQDNVWTQALPRAGFLLHVRRVCTAHTRLGPSHASAAGRFPSAHAGVHAQFKCSAVPHGHPLTVAGSREAHGRTGNHCEDRPVRSSLRRKAGVAVHTGRCRAEHSGTPDSAPTRSGDSHVGSSLREAAKSRSEKGLSWFPELSDQTGLQRQGQMGSDSAS